jgi:flagellar biosynthesis/type III secretory pathway protein FliH
MTGVMTQWMKDRLARQHEKARQEGRQEGLEKGFEEGRLKACREANAWARRQGVNPPFPDVEDEPAAP